MSREGKDRDGGVHGPEEDAGLLLTREPRDGHAGRERWGSLRCYLGLEYLAFVAGGQPDPEGGCWVTCSNQSGTRGPSQALLGTSLSLLWGDEGLEGTHRSGQGREAQVGWV